MEEEIIRKTIDDFIARDGKTDITIQDRVIESGLQDCLAEILQNLMEFGKFSLTINYFSSGDSVVDVSDDIEYDGESGRLEVRHQPDGLNYNGEDFGYIQVFNVTPVEYAHKKIVFPKNIASLEIDWISVEKEDDSEKDGRLGSIAINQSMKEDAMEKINLGKTGNNNMLIGGPYLTLTTYVPQIRMSFR